MILSHALWMRRFGGDPNILGRWLRLNEATFTVIGVLPASFQSLALSQGDSPREMFAPLGYELGQRDACRTCRHLRLIGRLKPGVGPREAGAELNTILAVIAREHPDNYASGTQIAITPLRDHLLGRVGTALWVLLGAVGFVLLIACANVANLLLARATGRAKELALRTALGAGRGRLIRQLLTESLVLALAGGVAGVALAVWGTSLVASLGPAQIPRVSEVRVDVPVLLFGLAASLFAGILFGLAPALRGSRVDLNDALKDLGKSTESRAKHGLRNALVTVELALAFVLVVGAGLLGKSFLHLMNVDPGFDPHNVLTVNTYVYADRYALHPEAELSYYSQVFDRLRSTPGFDSVAMVSTLPFGGFDRTAFFIEGRLPSSDADAPSVDRYSITPDYFRVMRIPIKRGRAFTDQDRQGAPLVAVISESCARSLFPGEDPLGKHIQLSNHKTASWATVVGVAGDVRQYGLDRAPNMETYLPQAQNVNFSYLLVARTTLDPRRLDRAVREAFTAVDKTQPVFDVLPMETYLQATLAERTFTLTLLALFGALALLLAAVGIYGVISYAVSLRTREVGIRMALGARRSDVLGMVLRQGMALIGVGLGAGFLASLALTRFLGTLLFDVRPTDLGTSVAVAILLAAAALLASYIPARRATRIDPMEALRYE